MFYPEDFKNRVKKVYPNWDELHRLLDSGDVVVGVYLDNTSPTALSLNTILTATSLKKLQEQAKIAQEKVALYHDWCTLYNKQNPH